MRLRIRWAGLAAAAGVLASTLAIGSSSHALSIDQQQTDTSVNLISFAFDRIVQSFVPGANDVAGAGVVLTTGLTTTGDLTLAIYDDRPVDGGTVLASATVVGATGQSAWIDAFWSPLTVVPGNTYYLVATAANITDIPGNYILMGSGTDTYPNGQLFGEPFGSLSGNSFPNFDLAFRTFATPEPHPSLLLALSLVLLAATARSRGTPAARRG